MKISEYMAKRTTKQLKAEFKELDDLIFKVECCGVRDMFLHSEIAKELERRKK